MFSECVFEMCRQSKVGQKCRWSTRNDPANIAAHPVGKPVSALCLCPRWQVGNYCLTPFHVIHVFFNSSADHCGFQDADDRTPSPVVVSATDVLRQPPLFIPASAFVSGAPVQRLNKTKLRLSAEARLTCSGSRFLQHGNGAARIHYPSRRPSRREGFRRQGQGGLIFPQLRGVLCCRSPLDLSQGIP